MLFYEPLFEDDFILAVNKASGVPSHSLARDQASIDASTVEAKVLERHPSARILHRLDTGTSGVLLFAKKDNVYTEMREKFKLKLLEKFYVAWSHSPLHSKFRLPLRLELALGHHPKSAKRMVPLSPSKHIRIRGKPFPAITHVLSAKPVRLDGEPMTELFVRIETGVTHQIRVHLAHLGFPLAGDLLYNREAQETHRLGLHARKVAFKLRGCQYEIEAPVPGSLRRDLV